RGDTDVGDAVPGDRLVVHLGAEGLVGRVAGVGLGHGLARGLVQGTRQLEHAVAPIDQDHRAHAAPGQVADDGLADAAGRPGHDGNLVCDLHGDTSSRGVRGESGVRSTQYTVPSAQAASIGTVYWVRGTFPSP